METVEVWYLIQDGQDGSANVRWFLTEEDAETWSEGRDFIMSDCGPESVDTYVGSNIHKWATEESAELHAEDDDEDEWD